MADNEVVDNGRVDQELVSPDIFTSDEDRGKFLSYVCSEILDVRDGSDRQDLIAEWKEFRRISQAIPISEERDTPWIKASNVEPPLTMQKVQTIYAKLVAAFSMKDPPVTVVAFNDADRDIAQSLENCFKGMAINKYGLNVNKVFKQIAYDVVRMGTSVVRVPFKVEKWNFKRQNPQGGLEQVAFVRHQGPEIIPIRLEDFFTRPYWKDMQRAPWLATRYRFFLHELKQFEGQGFFQNVDNILGQPVTQYDESMQDALEKAKVGTSSVGQVEENHEFEVYEVYAFWDVDNDGIPEDVIAWVEPETKTLLRSQFNPLSIRDVEVFTYMDNPDSLYGIGIGHMTRSLQEEVTALHRMRLDGTQLSFLKMFIAKKGAGIGPNEEFYPFKLMLLDDPSQDFKAIDFPDISQGAIIAENLAQGYADRVTGANDYMAGFNDRTVGSGATSSGTMFLAQQANSILDSLRENTEQSMTNVYTLALYQMIANRDLVDLSWLSPEDQANMQIVLGMRVEDIPTKFRFTVKSTDISETASAKKNNFLMVSQLYNQYGQQALQTLVALSNPQLAQNAQAKELLMSMYVGQAKLMEAMLQYFDVGNPGDFLPFTGQMELQMRMADQIRGQQVLQMKGAINGQQSGGLPPENQGGIPNAAGGGVGGGGGLQGDQALAQMAAAASLGANGQGAGAPGAIQATGQI